MALVGECVATEPSYFEEEVQQPFWMDTMVEEYDSIMRNNVWDVVPRLGDKSVVTSQWLYKVKQVADGSIEKHKVRFVARGFTQVEGIDYDETFAPIARINKYFTDLGLTKSEADANLYHIIVNGKLLIILLYVDDLILTGDDELIKSCKKDLAREFEMKDMGLMHYFLGMEVWQRDGEVFVSQGKYANEILRNFHMDMCKPMETPLVGNWRKEDVTSGELSQAMVQPTMLFWKATKHVLRYLRGTAQHGLWYKQTEGVKIQGFTDADWAGSPSDKKSTSEGIFNLGSAAVSWYSQK
eukprot:PITA_03356